MHPQDDCVITTDFTQLDFHVIHDFLRQSYWAKNIPQDLVEKSLRHSLCFGVLKAGHQVGFARIITDYATFAYLADVFVVPEHRGQGISKRLMNAIINHPELQGLRRWLLVTEDAHGLYEQFGFKPIPNPNKFMTIHQPNLYSISDHPHE